MGFKKNSACTIVHSGFHKSQEAKELFQVKYSVSLSFFIERALGRVERLNVQTWRCFGPFPMVWSVNSLRQFEVGTGNENIAAGLNEQHGWN